MKDYQPIENYGIIGDLNTVALIGLNGSIDFMCFPNFDSPSVFAALLDKNKGGNFQIHPIDQEIKYKQLYLPDTNILLTRFLLKEGVGEVTDFMPVEKLYGGKEIVRRVSTVRGEVTFRMNCSPRFNYARSKHTATKSNNNEITFTSNDENKLSLKLTSSIPLKILNEDGYCEFTLQPGEYVDFILEKLHPDEKLDPKKYKGIPLKDFVEQSLTETIAYWKEWTSRSTFKGRWMEEVNRSAMVLKLLTSFEHGSIVASPTFSLPEHIGGTRNWDYRYTWIRDSSFTIYALIKLNYKDEAEAFVKWIEKECIGLKHPGSLGLMYQINGRTELSEIELEHLEGYKGSYPVRIGNRAYKQYQLDIYGELMDAIYLYDKHVQKISNDFWNSLSSQMDWLCDHWQDEDNGIWEIRSDKKCFLHSRLMCWVALDRSIKISENRSFPRSKRWKKERDLIYKSIFEKFWNDDKKSFVQYLGADTVDASMLLMPLLKFISPIDPKWISTLEEIERELVIDCLVYRYQSEKFSDGFKHPEGTFSMCSFWYVECLSRAGQHQKAQYFFEKTLGYANHLGLFSEQLGIQGEHLGNFPQGFSHIGLISAAYDLNRRLDQENVSNKTDSK